MSQNSPSSEGTPDATALVAALRQHIATLEQTLDAQTQTIMQLRDENALLHTVIDQVPYAIYWKDRDLVYRGCNRRFVTDLWKSTPEEVIGRTDRELPWQSADVTSFEETDRRILQTQMLEYDDERVIYTDGTQEWFETYKLPLFDRAGQVIGVLASYNNISARKQAEATVLAQSTLLRELSTPVIPLTDDILVVPLVGTIDDRRAQQVLETVLTQLAASHARIVILDITGVAVIDTQVAQTFIQTGMAVQLLGGQLVLTGIRPEVAQSLVSLGVDLGSIVSYSNLQYGLADVYTTGLSSTIRRGKR